MVIRELVRFGPSFPVEAVKACALVGLHRMAEENSWQSDSGSSVSSSSSSENGVSNEAGLGGGKGGPGLPQSIGCAVPRGKRS